MDNEKEFNIHNKTPREVICIRNDDNVYGGEDGKLLEVGAIYHVDGVEVHDWFTVVYITEFPALGFNSVLFEEV